MDLKSKIIGFAIGGILFAQGAVVAQQRLQVKGDLVCLTSPEGTETCQPLEGNLAVWLQPGAKGATLQGVNLDGTVTGANGTDCAAIVKELQARNTVFSLDPATQTLDIHADHCSLIDRASGKATATYWLKNGQSVALMRLKGTSMILGNLMATEACRNYLDVSYVVDSLSRAHGAPRMVILYSYDRLRLLAAEGGLSILVEKPAVHDPLELVGIDPFRLWEAFVQGGSGAGTVHFLGLDGNPLPDAGIQGLPYYEKSGTVLEAFELARRRLGEKPACTLTGRFHIVLCGNTLYFTEIATGRKYQIPAFECNLGLLVDSAAGTVGIYIEAGCAFTGAVTLPCTLR